MSYELLFTTLLLFISPTRSQETIVKLGAFSHLVQYIRIESDNTIHIKMSNDVYNFEFKSDPCTPSAAQCFSNTGMKYYHTLDNELSVFNFYNNPWTVQEILPRQRTFIIHSNLTKLYKGSTVELSSKVINMEVMEYHEDTNEVTLKCNLDGIDNTMDELDISESISPQPNFFAMIEKDGNVIARDDLLNREYGSKDPEIMCNRLEETQKDNYKTCWSITCDEEYSLIGFGNGLTRGYSNELISRHMNNNMQGVWLSLFKDIKPQNKIFEFTKNILIHNIDHTKLVNQLLLSLDQYKNLIKLFLHGVTRYKK
ncbi:hypothetical protein AADDAKMG_00048 [Ostreid herpesvirus 1]|nr:hypothetical protein LKIMDMGE_00049 [Ostreid herpesvirus 1]UPX72374.1 hypothetical protein AADDAKMG_00048 [Ostreid herpesvirus 1]UPX72533.1 hypothetical protein CEAEFCCE_00048 [Ostreid herpesvirus 1]UPX72695.1 hypothetical protein FJINLJCC_00050 [Ostreid herpesvirus 1]UPX72854.1 hypothetical protein KIOFAAIH_00047 [Ostreid herpesvirus 1]